VSENSQRQNPSACYVSVADVQSPPENLPSAVAPEGFAGEGRLPRVGDDRSVKGKDVIPKNVRGDAFHVAPAAPPGGHLRHVARRAQRGEAVVFVVHEVSQPDDGIFDENVVAGLLDGHAAILTDHLRVPAVKPREFHVQAEFGRVEVQRKILDQGVWGGQWHEHLAYRAST